MKAYLLCAGKSTRTYPLTVNIPKPLLRVLDKTILEHTLEALKGLVTEAVLVVHFKKELIRKAVRGYKGLKVSTIEQKEPKGTGDAVKTIARREKGRFLLLMGDNIYLKQDLARLIKKEDALLADTTDHPERYGVLTVGTSRGKKVLRGIEEKPKKPKGKLINGGAYVFRPAIFDLLSRMKASPRGEWEFTDVIAAYAKSTPVEVVYAAKVYQVSYPWDLLTVNEEFVKSVKQSSIKGKVEKHAILKGPVVVGKGTVIKSGVHIEGPVVIGEHCEIGPNCYIRGGATIGNHCKVGNACEIKNSLLMDHVCAGHLTYLGDSIVGEHTNLGAGTITANLRHDNADIKTFVKGELVTTDRRKLGTIIGDHVHTGIHTSILPGRKIWPGKSTHPGEVVNKDVM